MAFLSKLGNMLRQSTTRQIMSQISSSRPAIFQAIRCMSSSKVFIGGISYSTDEQSLTETFGKYGEVTEARIIMDRETGRSRGFAFVTFTSSEEASSAIQALDGQDFQGRRIKVNYAHDRPGGSHGAGFGGNYGPSGGGYGNAGYGGGGAGGYGSYNNGDAGGYGGGAGAGGFGGAAGAGDYGRAAGGDYGGSAGGGYGGAAASRSTGYGGGAGGYGDSSGNGQFGDIGSNSQFGGGNTQFGGAGSQFGSHIDGNNQFSGSSSQFGDLSGNINQSAHDAVPSNILDSEPNYLKEQQ